MALTKPTAKKATAKAAPAKKAMTPKKRVVEQEPDEDEPEEEGGDQGLELLTSMGENPAVIRIHKSQSYKLVDGCLDNTTVHVDITVDADMDAETIAHEITRARIALAIALGADYVVEGESVIIGTFTPTKEAVRDGRDTPVSEIGKAKSGPARSGTAKKGPSSSGGGQRGGAGSKAHYTKEEVSAIWEDFVDNPDDYWDNTDAEENSFPHIKIKDDDNEAVLERLSIDEKENKPLYVKSAPKWVKDNLAGE